jgi:hypothetical protein
MAIRVYKETVLKWLRNAGITGGTLIGAYFLYLVAIGAITVVSHSGDMICGGTQSDPCIANISFCVNKVYGKVNDIFLYPTDYDPWGRNTTFDFDPAVSGWKLQRKWGEGWRTYNLTQPCRSSWCGYGSKSPYSKFSVAFREGKCYDIRILGYKHDPEDEIKWGAFDGKIDPVWLGKGSQSVKCTFNRKYSPNNVIIGGPLYADENCTRIEEAKSLKNCQFCNNLNLVVKSDKTHLVDVEDYNFTSIILNVSYNESFLGEYEYELEDNKMKTKIKVLTQLDNGSYNTSEIEIEIEEGQKIKYTLPFGLDKIIKLGSNSTTIQLQDNETELLGDTFINALVTENNYGITDNPRIGSGSSEPVNYISYIKFNNTVVPENNLILDSKLCLFISSNFYDSGETSNLSVYELDNQTWTQGTQDGDPGNPSWDNPVIGIGDLISFNATIDGDADDFWICLNVTSWVDSEYTNSKDNVSFVLKSYEVPPSGESDYLIFWSREYTVDTSLRPYLNITYTEASDSTPPSITLGGPANASTNTSLTMNFTFTPVTNDDIKNCTVWTNETSWSAKETNTSAITNNTLYGISETFSGDGTFLWNVECYDTTGNGNFSTNNYTLTIDSTAPTWSNNKTNLTTSTTDGSSVYFNITVTEENPDKYVFSWYNGTIWGNDTPASYSNGQELNVTKTINIESGDINWTWYFNDTAGNTNQSDIWSITIISPSLNVTWITPTLNGNHTQNEFDEYTVQVCCLNKDCGEINVSLDPRK